MNTSCNFFAMMSRMKYIERWALMRNSETENISEHSLEVAMLAHALAVISNVRLGNSLNVERAALLALYHDTTEIITGDMPTPIKYYNKEIRKAYQEIEEAAAKNLLSMLPDDIRGYYDSLFFKKEEEEYLWKIVKAADKLSAHIKCIKEQKAGNKEFDSAYINTYNAVWDMDVPEAHIFIEKFLGAYHENLDTLNKDTLRKEK